MNHLKNFIERFNPKDTGKIKFRQAVFSTVISCFALTQAFSQGFLNTGPYNSPCCAALYNFGGGANNVVPCGPSANTTSSVAIHGQGAHAATCAGGTSNIIAANLNCGTNGQNYNGTSSVLWVSFVINTGGSFEWQTVPGADKFTWTLFYATDPVDTPAEETTQSGCSNLVELSCGDQFTGWEIESTPDPTKRWRYYIAFFLNPSDKDGVGDGVMKIRKSCGLACPPPATTTPTLGISCITSPSGSTTLSPGTTGASYFWSAVPADATLSGQEQAQNPSVSPDVTTTYFVTVVGADGCPAATGQVTLQVDNCIFCDAEAGTLSNNGTAPLTTCVNSTSLNGVLFFASGQNNTLAYALILTDMAGNKQQVVVGNSGSFMFNSLPAGMYFVHGLSYDESQNTPNNISTYLTGITNISQIQADIAAQTNIKCADLEPGGTTNKITILNVDCGTFPQP